MYVTDACIIWYGSSELLWVGGKKSTEWGGVPGGNGVVVSEYHEPWVRRSRYSAGTGLCSLVCISSQGRESYRASDKLAIGDLCQIAVPYRIVPYAPLSKEGINCSKCCGKSVFSLPDRLARTGIHVRWIVIWCTTTATAANHGERKKKFLLALLPLFPSLSFFLSLFSSEQGYTGR